MGTKTVQLTGAKAVVALLLVGGFTGYRFVRARQAFSDEARTVLAFELQSEYARHYLRGLTAQSITPAMVDSLTATANITFPSLSALGSLDETMVRAEFLIDGEPPPDGRSVRYYRMTYGSLIGWRVEREVGRLGYYLAIF